MELAYDMCISCLQLISISSPNSYDKRLYCKCSIKLFIITVVLDTNI